MLTHSLYLTARGWQAAAQQFSRKSRGRSPGSSREETPKEGAAPVAGRRCIRAEM
jgi:hypothetical protein